MFMWKRAWLVSEAVLTVIFEPNVWKMFLTNILVSEACYWDGSLLIINYELNA
jgi:hypothetical protein